MPIERSLTHVLLFYYSYFSGEKLTQNVHDLGKRLLGMSSKRVNQTFNMRIPTLQKPFTAGFFQT